MVVLRQGRKNAKLTQAKISRILWVPQSVICDIENTRPRLGWETTEIVLKSQKAAEPREDEEPSLNIRVF